MNKSGIIVIDKPAGWSSFKVVQAAKKTLKVKRAGHTGTLDPFATGVLPVCVNEATKAIQFLPEDEKEYEGVLVLGVTMDTFDVTGNIIKTLNVPDITLDEVQRVLGDFTGIIKQTPPPFAAVKFKGKPLYYWARKGVFVEKEAREVTIRELTIKKFVLPEISFRVVCSKGTYVRALVNDIGQKVGCGAYLKELRRLRSGPFTIQQAVIPEAIKEKHILSVSDILYQMPSVKVGDPVVRKVQQGRELFLKETEISATLGKMGKPWVRVLSKDGDLLAIYAWNDNSWDLKPVRVFKKCS